MPVIVSIALLFLSVARDRWPFRAIAVSLACLAVFIASSFIGHSTLTFSDFLDAVVRGSVLYIVGSSLAFASARLVVKAADRL
ncbi:MAG TPA: hypothetical protein VNI20_04650 [Fimbriimonadaceae bacterium]|nr:hypothetical protein [Fimbriimonadaceae bacterium]